MATSESKSMGDVAAETLMKKLGRSLEDMGHNELLTDASGKSIKATRYQGKLFPPFGELAISQMKYMEVREDDVAILGYPKTGCHWTFEILCMILHKRTEIKGIGKGEAFLEMAAPEVVKAIPSPRVINTHVTYDFLPDQMVEKKTKIVLTVRNPKDTLVSFFNHHKKLSPLYGYDGDFKDYFPMFLDGKVDYGSYFDYHASWDKALQEHKDHPIIVMAFEDMKENLPKEVRRLAKFLGVDLDDDMIDAIAKAGGFDSMVKVGNIPHALRKGQVGDWQNWFTVAQNEQIDAVIKEKMAGITFFKPRYTLP